MTVAVGSPVTRAAECDDWSSLTSMTTTCRVDDDIDEIVHSLSVRTVRHTASLSHALSVLLAYTIKKYNAYSLTQFIADYFYRISYCE